MKFSISKEGLSNALQIVLKALSSRSTLPILSGVLISCSDGHVTLQTTDLELSIQHSVEAMVLEDGQTVVPGKLFNDIIKSLPDAAVDITLENQALSISCMTSDFSIKTLNPDEFPRFPEVSPEKTITLPAPKLASMVKQVSKAVSRDESRAILTGILFTIEDINLRLVATDSYRLAVRETTLETVPEEGIEVVIPGKTFDEIMRSASHEEDITIGISENQIIFSFDKTVCVTRKIEGNFPNYKQLIPKTEMTTAVVPTDELFDSIKRIALLAQGTSPIKLMLSDEDQNINISSNTQDVGLAKEDLTAKVEGESTEIAFNHTYLLDGLSSMDSSEVQVQVVNPMKPGIFRSVGDEFFFYLAMPIRIR